MNRAIMAMLAFALAAAMSWAIPIPTSVFGTIEDGQFTVALKVNNATDTLHSLHAQTQDGRYAIVFATQGIRLVNVEMAVFRGSSMLYNKTYTGIETGSKLNVDLLFELQMPPTETVKIEKPGSGGGGGGGGTYEPTIKDIPKLREEYETKTNSTAPNMVGDENSTAPAEQDDSQNETGEIPAYDKPLIELPKITQRDNQLFKLGTIILILLLIIMIIQRRARHE